MDVCARSAYQMGKSPVLPMLALTLGVSEGLIGLAESSR